MRTIEPPNTAIPMIAKNIRPIILLLFLCSIGHANPSPPLELTTLEGKTYKSVVIRKIEPDGISVTHESGATKIAFEQLPENLRSQYGLDEKSARAYREALVRNAQNAAIAAQDATLRKTSAEEAKKKQEDALIKTRNCAKHLQIKCNSKSTEVVDGLSRKGAWVRIHVDTQKQQSGVTCDVIEGHPGKVSVKNGKLVTARVDGWVFDKEPRDSLIEGSWAAGKKNGSDELISVTGNDNGIYWQIGRGRIQDIDGTSRTLPRYTDNIEVAMKFYIQHGFGENSDAVVYFGNKLEFPTPLK